MTGIQAKSPRLTTTARKINRRGRLWICGFTPGDPRPLFVTLNTKQEPMFDNELFPGTRMGNQLWVEPVGELVLARLRGMATEALCVECQRQVLQILRDQGGGKVLYDALEMEAPPVEVALSQRTLDDTWGVLKSGARLSFPPANSPILHVGIWRRRLRRVLQRHQRGHQWARQGTVCVMPDSERLESQGDAVAGCREEFIASRFERRGARGLARSEPSRGTAAAADRPHRCSPAAGTQTRSTGACTT